MNINDNVKLKEKMKISTNPVIYITTNAIGTIDEIDPPGCLYPTCVVKFPIAGLDIVIRIPEMSLIQA